MSSTLGLTWCPAFYRDTVFSGAVLAGIGFWLALWLCVSVQPITVAQVLSPAFLALAVWQPIL